jgi:4-hydroxy-2-oxoheptanedioate aldolase
MAIRPNTMKAVMQSGKLAVSFNVNRWRSVDAAEIAKVAGFEWLFLDLEHSVISEEIACQIAITSLAVGVAPIARVGTDQFYQAARLLDGGVYGIIFPHVDSATQAAACVKATKYPPLGARSLTGPLPQAEFGHGADPKVMGKLNEETLTIVMVETLTALENVEAIAAVKGVDAVLIGTNDLAADMGIPGQLGDERIGVAYQRVGAAVKKAGKFFGMGGVYSRELMQRYLKTGVQFTLGGADIGFVMEGAKARREMIAGL